jgi:hypothetical protein
METYCEPLSLWCTRASLRSGWRAYSACSRAADDFPADLEPALPAPDGAGGGEGIRATGAPERIVAGALALAWCYSRPFVASTIIGATSLGQLKENIDAFETTLPGEGIAAIDAIHARMPNPGQ